MRREVYGPLVFFGGFGAGISMMIAGSGGTPQTNEDLNSKVEGIYQDAGKNLVQEGTDAKILQYDTTQRIEQTKLKFSQENAEITENTNLIKIGGGVIAVSLLSPFAIGVMEISRQKRLLPHKNRP